MKEKGRGKERYLEKGGGSGRREGKPVKVVTKEKGERKGKREAEKECVYVFIERVCRIMCVLCNTVSSDRGWGEVDWVDLATVRPISSSAV